jgi:hypothetical protein
MNIFLHPFALYCGFFWGGSLVFLSFLSKKNLYYEKWINTLKIVYRGYSNSLKGTIIGFLWGIIDAYFLGVIIVWITKFF